jgi:hypothetical protein
MPTLTSRHCAILLTSLLFAIDAGASCYTELKQKFPVPGTVVFGEIHGTNEIPEFFLDCVKEFVSHKEPLGVYLEIPASDGKLVQGYIDNKIDAAKLLGLAHWRKQDGRASMAMFELVNDLEMTKNFMNNYSPDKYNMVLTGNLHARASSGSPWDPSFKPFAHYLRSRISKLVSLDVKYGTGSAWICAPGCGANPLPDSRTRFAPTPAIQFDATSAAFDGYYAIEKLSASPPVARDRPKTN